MEDTNGRRVKATLRGALHIPSYPQDIFSVKSATTNGASVTFQHGRNQLVHKDGTRFDIEERNRLYYLITYDNGEHELENDECHACYDVQTWHEILGHCNYDDVLKLESVTKGMKVKNKTECNLPPCEICIQGKFAQSRNRMADVKA